jgi:excisionase family DNA binding protein
MREFDETLLSVHDLAELFKVPPSWVYQRTRARGRTQLPHIKLGKYLRFDRRAVMAWLEGQSSAPANDKRSDER